MSCSGSPTTPRSSEEVKTLVDGEPEVYVSPATVWEVTIKQALGKIKHPAELPERIRDSDFRELPIRLDHAIAAGRLPLIHRDPFDVSPGGTAASRRPLGRGDLGGSRASGGGQPGRWQVSTPLVQASSCLLGFRFEGL